MILHEILSSVREELEMRRSQKPLAQIEQAIAHREPPRDFAAALKEKGIGLIAEIKRASPSKGVLRPNLDAARWARLYSQSGAAAISVLTESEHFQGSLADLAQVREEVAIPLLDKDFIIDSYQIYEARAHGADAVLLITAILPQNELKTLLRITHSLGMAALIEVHNREEMSHTLEVAPRLIGINNRNLANLSVSLNTTLELRLLIPEGTVIVSESGIHNRDDVLRLEQAGVDAILVGEALVTSPNPEAKIDELLGRNI